MVAFQWIYVTLKKKKSRRLQRQKEKKIEESQTQKRIFSFSEKGESLSYCNQSL